ncbi:MAG: dTDP-4-dehydrorhamnose reductase [Negativicutes bacterium]|jgi:dTDP-4-dehydrorhamnose reductase|nr:dTDP-4-dehydrorhamnose reductase [Negativicutes bacterium]
MKVLVTGVAGQLGYDVIKELESHQIEYLGVDRDTMDLTDENAVRQVITNFGPDAVIHCAAYTAVDKAEDDVEACRKVNVDGTRYIAEVCREINAKMVYISTDYVFPGTGEQFYEVDDIKGPQNVYGQSKYDGELEVQRLLEKYFIVRISWVFGINGNNFIKTMLRLGETRNALTVVADQIGSPTYTYDLAKLLVEMVENEQYGVYHAHNEGVCSWAEFATEIFKQANLNVTVIPVPSTEYPTRAARPLNSRMSTARLTEKGFGLLPIWQDALKRYIREL